MVYFAVCICSGISCAWRCNLSLESSGTANSSVTTAMQGVANDMLATGNAIIPIALDCSWYRAGSRFRRPDL